MVLTTLRRLFEHRSPTPPQPIDRSTRFKPEVEGLEHRCVPATRVVNPGESIQAALDQSRAGDKVLVKSGTYAQQVVIAKDRISLVAQGSVTIQAPGTLKGDRSIVRVTGGADDVLIKGLNIKATAASATNIFAGIRIDDKSSATVRDNVISGLFEHAGSANEGIGILVGNNYSSGDRSDRGEAKILNNRIERYHAAGVVVNGTHSSAHVGDNTITGAGVTDIVSQYGIQISADADARVIDNSIRDNDLAGDDVTSTGILVFDATDCVLMACNDLTGNDGGITLFAARNATVTRNNVSRNNGNGISLVSDDPSAPLLPGVKLPTTRDNQICFNLVRGNGTATTNLADLDAGIALYDASRNDIKGNRVEDTAGDGILVWGGRDNELADNHSTSNRGDGIVLGQTAGNRVTFGVIGGNRGNGITLLDADRNTIRLNAVVGNRGAGLSIDDASEGNDVRSNLVAFNDCDR